MIQNLLLNFYRLPIHRAVSLILLCTIVFRYLHQRWHNARIWRLALSTLAAICVLFIFYSTLFTRETGGTHDHYFIPFHSYRAVLAGENIEILRSNFMNTVLFYPAGLFLFSLLPSKWSRTSRILVIFLGAICLSVGIECIQYMFALGVAEADDVLHNSLGAMLGSLLGCIPMEPWRWFQPIPCPQA
jgi:glycopeptide antibiotics resistance protein